MTVGEITIAHDRVGKGAEPKLVLYIRQRPVLATQTNIALLASLCDDAGCVVPYARLCAAVGHADANDRAKHVLRQYIRELRRLLGHPEQ